MKKSARKQTKKVAFPSKESLGITYLGVRIRNYRLTDGSVKTSWRAYFNGTYLGNFATPELAAMAHNKAAKMYYRTERKARLANAWNDIAA